MELLKAKQIFKSVLDGRADATWEEYAEALRFSIGLINYFIENQSLYNRKVKHLLPRLSPPPSPHD